LKVFSQRFQNNSLRSIDIRRDITQKNPLGHQKTSLGCDGTAWRPDLVSRIFFFWSVREQKIRKSRSAILKFDVNAMFLSNTPRRDSEALIRYTAPATAQMKIGLFRTPHSALRTSGRKVPLSTYRWSQVHRPHRWHGHRDRSQCVHITQPAAHMVHASWWLVSPV
jgi:hypothetical protein